MRYDRKEDNLENAERSFREEMREEIRLLKEDKKTLEEDKKMLLESLDIIRKDLNILNAASRLCLVLNPSNCPLNTTRQSNEN